MLGAIYSARALLIYLRVLPPRLISSAPISWPSGAEAWSLLLLNSASMTLACSTYHSYCGNGGRAGEVQQGAPRAGSGAGAGGGYLQAAICTKWLHPILTTDFPQFAAWMTYGEQSAQ